MAGFFSNFISLNERDLDSPILLAFDPHNIDVPFVFEEVELNQMAEKSINARYGYLPFCKLYQNLPCNTLGQKVFLAVQIFLTAQFYHQMFL